MKLALDELYAKEIAVQLRDRGHDVISVDERPNLGGLDDDVLFPLLASEQRALLTENWADYNLEMEKAAAEGRTHYGVIFTSRQKFSRSRNTIGQFVHALDEFLKQHPAEDALLNSSRWL